MELVYLWVENYKNIQKQGFDFSPRFKCKFHDEYDKDGNLKDNCKLDIIDHNDTINIFPDNINITAIIGENGSGKSSVLEILNIQQHPIDAKCFFIYIEKNEQCNALIYNMPIDKIDCIKILFTQSISILTTNDGCTCYKNGHEIEKKLQETTNTFTYNIENTSTKSDSFISTKSEDVFLSILKNQHLNNQKISSFFGKIEQVKIQENNNYINELKNKISSKTPISNNKLNEITQYINNIDNRQSFKSAVELYMYWMILHDEDNRNMFSTKLKNIDITNSKHYQYIKEKLQLYYQNVYSNDLDRQLPRNIDYKINEYFYVYNIINKNEEYPKLHQKIIENILYYYDFLKINFYDKNNKSFNDLSTGEQELFAQLYNINEKIENSNADNIVLLLDEPANSFHPKWQKEYIYELYNLLFNFPNKNFQLMITTHSPFLISDLPKQNIIFLKDGKQVEGTEKKQTFGANIHTLLSDSFFMRGGLMGEFAKGKIDEAITLLNKDKPTPKEIQYCEDIISIIGEPIIKNQLQKMLDSKRLKKVDKIDKIEREIRKLKNQLKEIVDDK